MKKRAKKLVITIVKIVGSKNEEQRRLKKRTYKD